MKMSDYPGQELIQILEQLRNTLNRSGVERTAGLLRELGDDCSYYRKSLDIFLRKDYDQIYNLLTQARDIMNKLESKG
jgi:hypothetical protein